MSYRDKIGYGEETYLSPCKTYRLRIQHDEDAESPREWDNLTTMILFHKGYAIGDKHDFKSDEYSGWTNMRLGLEKHYGDDLVKIMPVYGYDHGGFTISTSPFACSWDSGQVGFCIVLKSQVLEGGVDLDKVEDEDISGWIKGDVEMYAAYLSGQHYGFELELLHKCSECDRGEWEDIDSCWGFIGDHEKSGLLDHLEMYPEILDIIFAKENA